MKYVVILVINSSEKDIIVFCATSYIYDGIPNNYFGLKQIDLNVGAFSRILLSNHL